MTAEEMLEMRVNGAKYQEIADVCGITRQAVRQQIDRYVAKITQEKRGHKFSLKSMKYQGLYDYFKKNEHVTLSSFTRNAFGTTKSVRTVRNFIQGDSNSHFSISQIKRICEIVGKPFEEVFVERSDTE